MKTVATVNIVFLVIVGALAIYIGINPKKWQTWLLGLYCFLSFFLVGIVGTGNFYESVGVAAIVTFALIFRGIIEYRKREWARKWLKEHGENWE